LQQIDGMTVQNIDLFAEKINHYESALTLVSLFLYLFNNAIRIGM
ncbi:hypothetical protein T02_13908, partial [Trichinella nativa]